MGLGRFRVYRPAKGDIRIAAGKPSWTCSGNPLNVVVVIVLGYRDSLFFLLIYLLVVCCSMLTIIIGIVITTVIAIIVLVMLAPCSESKAGAVPPGAGVGKGVVLRGCSQLGDLVLKQALGFRV